MKNKDLPAGRQGFTLIEIMVSVGILGLIATMGTSLLFSVLGGSAKARSLQLVKQNGSYALSVMETMIRNARKIESVATATDYLTILNPDGGVTTFRCCGVSPDYLIASESGSLFCANARLTGSEVRVFSCTNFFTVTAGEPGVKPDKVAIGFKLLQSAVTTRPEDQAAVDFQTTVGLRNY